MGYLHIDNLYKNRDILLFKECYALEKIHGTSCHIIMEVKPNEITSIAFFSGGVNHNVFYALFDREAMLKKFKEYGYSSIVVFGEGYGGKCQRMKDTYGPDLKFVAFDVKVGDIWLDVPDMEEVAKSFGLDVVDWVKIPTDMDLIDKERDKFSVQAAKCGCGEDKLREGIVLRPLTEMKTKNGKRVIVKHKGEEFSERVHTPKVRETDATKLQKLTDAKEVAEEWVTAMRLLHVIDKLPKVTGMEDTRRVISAMIEDVQREGEGEIEWSKQVASAIGTRTAKIFKQYWHELARVEEKCLP